MKLLREVGSLRRGHVFDVVRRAILAGASRLGIRVVEYSAQRDHVHFIVEAADNDALSRGMKGLSIRIARGLNRRLGRAGRVMADRFHARALATPREVKHALSYVLGNARKHAAQRGKKLPARWLDPFSSASAFAGWRSARAPIDRDLPEARTWLLRVGWRRLGLLDPSAVPG
jgi:REP element-mobilizing transposase RayT